MTRFFAFLLWIFIATCPAIAAGPSLGEDVYYPETITCASTGQYQKCARLPNLSYNGNSTDIGEYANITVGTAVDDTKWTHFRNGVSVAGYAENVSVTEWPMGYTTLYQISADCVVTEPFSLVYRATTGRSTSMRSGAEACIQVAQTTDLLTYALEAPVTVAATAPNGDTCPDGFFTVPWESWCGEGMVNIADAPNCDDDTSGEYCLIASDKVACESGISNIKTSAGVIVPLYAEKYTEPALAVRYNGLVCYANLAPGQSAGAINVRYNDAVYHTEN